MLFVGVLYLFQSIFYFDSTIIIYNVENMIDIDSEKAPHCIGVGWLISVRSDR